MIQLAGNAFRPAQFFCREDMEDSLHTNFHVSRLSVYENVYGHNEIKLDPTQMEDGAKRDFDSHRTSFHVSTCPRAKRR